MTPELMEDGARRLAEWKQRRSTAVGPRSGASYGRAVAAGEVDTSHGVVLYIEEVTVSFDGFRALNGLSLEIGVGELRCVIGPNGAGKTTLMDVITGKTRPDEGRVFFGSNIDLLRLSESQIARYGIGRKFQKPTVFETLTVGENLELALKGDRRVRASFRQRLTSEARDRIASTLETIRLAPLQKERAGALSHGQKQWLEIGMLLIQEPKLLLLDEPVAGMTDEETDRTAELILSLEGSHSLMVVEHDMRFIKTLVEAGQQARPKRVTVLHEGRVLAEGPLSTVQNDPRVIEVYLGR
ncbi:MAG: urea ABC transporter ATP-binding protein UrtD [Casimicrobiaceae bacterium]|nr:urea ABC transporter ATP-binding protein UrtD [Casimicrobiaceae bacterium]MDW8312136.1 urea ABC transporter ATP-binding protein UrtD [Burkholderiales bacterium]